MQINEQTKVGKLIDDYPYLIDFLVKLNPEFSKLKNPILRNTVGRVATIKHAAGMAHIEMSTLISKIAQEIEKQSGVKVDVVDVNNISAKEVNDSKESRLGILKDIIKDIHKGVDFDILKIRFQELIKDVSPSEIANMEQKLIEEGMPESEITKLCDVHAKIFEESLLKNELPGVNPGHPVHTYMKENQEIEKRVQFIEKTINEVEKIDDGFINVIHEKILDLEKIDIHYKRKENQLFPLLEKKNVSGPSSVMWAIHDDIRKKIKEFKIKIGESSLKKDVILSGFQELSKMVLDMIFKEERILYPMALEILSDEDWERVLHGEEEIGFAWVIPDLSPHGTKRAGQEKILDNLGHFLKLDTGALSLQQINLLINHLPLDVTFVDEHDTVRFYSKGVGGIDERIFPRSPAIIGRKVQKCHPPKSLHIVENILNEFKKGNRKVAEFWLQSPDKFIHIRYIAIFDNNNAYKGTLEVMQNITDIKKLEGERRLLDWS